MSDSIKQTGQEGVVTLTIDNPPMNPLGIAQITALEELIPELGADPSVRAIVIRGAGGRNFSVGANLKEGHLAAEVGTAVFSQQRIDVFNAIEALEKPVIAAIEGYCLGGGMELAMACHFRIAREDAQLGLPEIDLGMAPLWSGAGRVLRLVGRARALELLVMGTKISAFDAMEYGLVTDVYTEEEFDEAVAEFAGELAGKAPLAVAAIIRVINESQDLPLQQALAKELEGFAHLAGTKDSIEGISAMFEKRKPHFTGE